MEFASKTRHAKPVQRAKPSRVAPSRPVNRDSQAEISRVLRSVGVQAKLSIGQPNDKYEQEADRVADQMLTDQIVAPISSMDASRPPSSAGPSTQLKSNENEDEVQTKRIQRQVQPEEEGNPVQTKRIQRQAQPEEEEKPVQTKRIQRQAQPEEEEVQTCLQRMSNEEEDVQAKLSRKPTGYLQAKGTPELSDDAEQKIQQMRGQGDPLPKGVRQETENKIGADFSAVRIHNNSAANDINKQINARAFTLGNDIYFASGEYSPTTASGKKLLAHELTHVVQQNSLVQRVVQRSAGTSQRDPDGVSEDLIIDAAALPYSVGKLEGDVITFDEVEVPNFKLEDHRKSLYESRHLRQKKGYVRETAEGQDPRQRNLWKDTVSEDSTRIVDKLKEKAKRGLGAPSVNINDSFVFKGVTKRGADRYFIGSLSVIAKELTLPSWGKNGIKHSYDVDHIVELQLANWNDDPWGNTLPNIELLDSSTNRSSGGTIRASIDRKVRGFIDATHGQHGTTIAQVKGSYHLAFLAAEEGGGGSVSSNDFWLKDEIQRGEQVDPLILGSPADLGGVGEVRIYPDITGGQAKGFKWRGEGEEGIEGGERDWIAPFAITAKQFNVGEGSEVSENIGTLSFIVPESDPSLKPFPDGEETLPLKRIPGARYAGYVDKRALRAILNRRMKSKHFSPVEISTFDILPEGGVSAGGRILPQIPLFGGSGIDFSLTGSDLTFYKQFLIDDIQVPSPFEMRESSLTVLFSTERGLGVEGRADFGISGVGEGYLGAGATTEGGLNFEGSLSFDTSLFDPAEVSINYADDTFSASGQIGIKEGTVGGVKVATIQVDYSETEGFSASGDAELDVPGVESGRLEITHNEESGFSMGGEFSLSADAPGIRSGNISAQVREKEDGSGYAVSASGTAIPDIPGIDSEMTISYNDGAFTAEVTADYSRGMLSGQVNAGVTNRSVGEDGALSETAEPGNPLIVYGGGNLTIEIAPWLQGTAGVRFAPNGEITVTGEIGLPSEFEIFPRREVEKSIFSIAVQAPIFPGIVAEIGGGLGATAGFGPGVIDQLQLGITYNPAHEEDTTITGDAHLKVPADAGLRLSLRAGIGLGITGVSVTGGLEIGGSLGIEGAAEAGVHIEWSPSQGLELMANVGVHAQPAFVFDVGGYVSVRALGFSVYDQTWNFASFRFGSDYRFGITLPIHYREGEPFNISLSDVQFEVPNIDTDQLLKGLIARVA